MAKSHYSFKKRKKELKRQEKQEKKRQRRLAKNAPPEEVSDDIGSESEGDQKIEVEDPQTENL